MGRRKRIAGGYGGLNLIGYRIANAYNTLRWDRRSHQSVRKLVHLKNIFGRTGVGISDHCSTIWHELTHASNYNLVENIEGYWYAGDYWTSVIATELSHSNNYGAEGDNNWQQIALVEGWANFNEYRLKNNYLFGTSFNGYETFNFPYKYINFFYNLETIGCSIPNMEKCLTAKTISEFKQLLINIYPDLEDNITNTISEYE